MGLFGSDATDATVDPTIDALSVAELQNAAITPISTDETQLYSKSGKACCWADSELYAFRLRQLEIINYAIQVMSSELWKDTRLFTTAFANDLQQKVMNYKDVDGRPVDNHGWDLLAEDKTFLNEEYGVNRFKEFRDYFIQNAGASKEKMKEDFERFLVLFVRYRDILIRLMFNSCTAQSGGGSRNKRRHGVSRR